MYRAHCLLPGGLHPHLGDGLHAAVLRRRPPHRARLVRDQHVEGPSASGSRRRARAAARVEEDAVKGVDVREVEALAKRRVAVVEDGAGAAVGGRGGRRRLRGRRGAGGPRRRRRRPCARAARSVSPVPPLVGRPPPSRNAAVDPFEQPRRRRRRRWRRGRRRVVVGADRSPSASARRAFSRSAHAHGYRRRLSLPPPSAQ